MSVSGNEIGDLLVDIGIITAEELASAMEEQSRSGDRLTLILDRLGLVTYHQLKDSLELQYGVNFISLSKNVPAREIADLVSVETKYKYKLIPVASTGTHFTIAMVNPDDLIALDTLRVELRSGHLKQLVCTADEFEFCMKELYEPPAVVVANEEVVASSDSDAAESLAEEFTLPASVIAQADALEKKVAPRVPAKKHLQSLFGDDDDEDDDDIMSSPLTPLVSPTESSTIAAEAVASVPVAEGIDDIAAAFAAAMAESAAKEVVEAVTSPVESSPVESSPQELVTPPTPDIESLVSAAQVLPQPNSVLERVVDQVIGTIATAVAAEPLVVADVTAPLVAQAEDAMQAALANVTNHLIESSLGALNVNANRKLLEDVVESELGGSEEETDIYRMKEAQNASVMLLAHEIIGKATQKRCSDIHLEPDISGVSLRYFLHGELLADCMLPLEIHGALVGSYKVIAGLNPQELVKPQDKKFITRVEEDEVELRITTIPTDNGEMVAISMRFTDPNSAGAIAQAKLSNLSEN
ncbi:MAG: ATPase, T2SS/T4P/T4SS family [Candidatus Obscuribacterales bacterium]